MRGIIVRADFGRGLANQTYSFYKALDWDVVVCVDMSGVQQAGGRPYEWSQDLTAYPDAIVTQWKGYQAHFENPDAHEALRACDLIYTAETYYDPRLEKVPAVLHVNPEFYRGEPAAQFWYPTTWHTDKLPPGEIVPTPILDEDLAFEPGEKLLHVGGHSARMDRNGSRIVHGLFGRVSHPWRVTSQDGMRMNPRVMGFVQPMGNVEDRWDLYRDCGILVYPRRYGGQSLQVNEAMARGLAVVMTDCPPNPDTWPIIPVPSRPAGQIQTPGGRFVMHMALAPQLTDILTRLVNDDEERGAWQKRSYEWAQDNSWSAWRDRIEALLG